MLQSSSLTVEDIGVAKQQELLALTVNSDLCREYPPSVQYQRSFVKKLLSVVSFLDCFTNSTLENSDYCISKFLAFEINTKVHMTYMLVSSPRSKSAMISHLLLIHSYQ